MCKVCVLCEPASRGARVSVHPNAAGAGPRAATLLDGG